MIPLLLLHASLTIPHEGRNIPMSSGSLPSLPFATRRALIERAAPLYQGASLAQKGLLLDQVVTLTGYARKYAIQLLNHAPQGRRAILRPRLPRYGSEVRHALILAREATRHLCAKRLIPFLPTCLAALERHGHLHLSEESRRQVLQV